MIFFLNGKFVPEDQAKVSVLDRGFLYGDGLFETMRAVDRTMPLWTLHWERLTAGAAFLGIRVPFTSDALLTACLTLLEQNQMPDATLRLTLTRGVGPRGYSPKGAENPVVAITIHPLPSQKEFFNAIVSKFVLPSNDPVAAFKNCNKLRQVLARAEADVAGADEAILLNEKGFAVEGASTNLFWFESQTVCTPPLCEGILAGVTRTFLLRLAKEQGWETAEKAITPADLCQRAGVFLSASTLGCVPVRRIGEAPIEMHPGVSLLQEAYWHSLKAHARQTALRP